MLTHCPPALLRFLQEELAFAGEGTVYSFIEALP